MQKDKQKKPKSSPASKPTAGTRGQRVYRRETVFEGFFSLYYDESYLSKKLEFRASEVRGNESVSRAFALAARWRQNCLRNLAEKEREEKYVSFTDLFPREVYRKLLQNLDTKFRFKFTVEAEEI